MTKPNFLVDVDVSNLEEAITTLISVLNRQIQATEELGHELKKIRLGTGLVTGVDLNEEEEKD